MFHNKPFTLFDICLQIVNQTIYSLKYLFKFKILKKNNFKKLATSHNS